MMVPQIIGCLIAVVILVTLASSTAMIIAMNWSSMNVADHLSLTLGLGVALLVFALARLRRGRLRVLRNSLLAVAATLLLAGTAIAIGEFF